MPELKPEHVKKAVGGVSIGALVLLLLQQMFAHAASEQERWDKHLEQETLLRERIAKLEARGNLYHGEPGPDEQQELAAAAAAEAAKPVPEKTP